MLMLARTYTVFFFNDTATTEIYTLSLHDALPISHELKPSNAAMMMLQRRIAFTLASASVASDAPGSGVTPTRGRSEEHTSELQSQSNLVCRLLLEKKKKKREYTALHSAPETQVRL